MAKIVSVNEFILHPKEFNGRRVVTFKDIDLVHGRAEGTARYRFRDNKKHFIEGEDYFVVDPQTLENAKMGEIRPSGIESVNVRGTTLITETGYLMLVKSFTDDLAWSVQRELVNNYFKIRQKKAEPLKPNRREVVDIPRNPQFQTVFTDIEKLLAAVEVTVKNVNCYTSKEDAEIRIKVAEGIAFRLLEKVSELTRIRCMLIPEPY